LRADGWKIFTKASAIERSSRSSHKQLGESLADADRASEQNPVETADENAVCHNAATKLGLTGPVKIIVFIAHAKAFSACQQKTSPAINGMKRQ
jgi:hypothetical protein